MNQRQQQRISVVLAKVHDYDMTVVKAVGDLLDAVCPPVSTGDVVLVKPNMLRADRAGVTCTNATIIAATCSYLLDKGCRVTIGDSPGFGNAKDIARVMGLPDALARLGCGGTPIISLDSPKNKALTLGGTVGISRHALEADHILNIPKMKAHVQMRVTASVKNLFGCVSGVHKAFLHFTHGDKGKNGIRVFPSAVVDIMQLLPPATTLLDGIEAMHVRGPSGGKKYPAHLLAASTSPVALDTALYSMLGVFPEDIPVWGELQRRRVHGAFLEDIDCTGEAVESFDFSGFILPEKLMSETFNPHRLLTSMVKRLWARAMPVQ